MLWIHGGGYISGDANDWQPKAMHSIAPAPLYLWSTAWRQNTCAWRITHSCGESETYPLPVRGCRVVD
jgi:hypothetical protein